MPEQRDLLDFIVVGAQKAGTSTLFQYLRRHPEICIPALKEVPYFSHDTVYKRGWEAYMREIGREQGTTDGVCKWGTVTPHYMVGGVYETANETDEGGGYDERTVPLRIHKRLHRVRLIAILRNPVERAISHHRMAVSIGREKRSFDTSIDHLLQPAMLERARRRPQERMGYVVWGEYGRILSGYFDVFPAEQILVVFTDELERTPGLLMHRIHKFIGVMPDFEPPNLGARYRVGKPERGFAWKDPSSWISPSSPVSPQGVRRAIGRVPAARALWDTLPPDSQRYLRLPYERIEYRTARWNRDSTPNRVSANAEPSLQTLERLWEHYEEDRERLAALTGLTPTWEAPRGTKIEDPHTADPAEG
jgi:hypothetical protein